ncbi:MAG: hypothetical protein EOO06_14450 [Chitinophagaceae bacterium]|nr:MAG: hypothetical protein EOO06_14450 [Chitinophagaceae bacterium]
MRSKSLLAILSLLCLLAFSASAQTKTSKASCTGDDDCCKKPATKETVNNKSSTIVTAVKKEKEVACKLSSPELQKHKAEVIALLKANVIERHELPMVTSIHSKDQIRCWMI